MTSSDSASHFKLCSRYKTPAHKDKASSILISSQRSHPNLEAAARRPVVVRHPPQIRRRTPAILLIRQPASHQQPSATKPPTPCAPTLLLTSEHHTADTRLRARELSGPVLLSQAPRVGTDERTQIHDRQAGVLVHEDKVIPSKIDDRPAKCPIVDPSTFSRGRRSPCCCGGPHGACNPRVLLCSLIDCVTFRMQISRANRLPEVLLKCGELSANCVSTWIDKWCDCFVELLGKDVITPHYVY